MGSETSDIRRRRSRRHVAVSPPRRGRDITRAKWLLGWVWIKLFRPVRAIAEPWDEGDGIEWAKMAVDRVTWQWLCGMPTPALCRGRLPSHWRPPLPGGGSGTATYPVADSHQARVNEGRTEERGPVIQRINRDLPNGSVRLPLARCALLPPLGRHGVAIGDWPAEPVAMERVSGLAAGAAADSC